MEKDKLRCLYWNIHGIYSQILGDKNNNHEFLKIIADFDVICISELHTNNVISIPGFCVMKQKFRPKNHKGPKIGGGIAVYISQELACNFRLTRMKMLTLFGSVRKDLMRQFWAFITVAQIMGTPISLRLFSMKLKNSIISKTHSFSGILMPAQRTNVKT